MDKAKIPHVHPMFVHFPQALFPAAFASFLLYLVTGARLFESGAFVAAFFGVMGVPVTIASGFIDWWARYQAYLTSVFKIKITGSFILLGLSLSAVLLRVFHPEIVALPLQGYGWLYGALLAACTANCVVLGYYGGKLVFH